MIAWAPDHRAHQQLTRTRVLITTAAASRTIGRPQPSTRSIGTTPACT